MSKKRIVFQGEPGANSHLAISQAYPDAEAVPCATFEDAFAALSARRRRPRHDPDREFGGRPRRRHPSSDAELEAAHRRRAFHAGAAPVARRQRRQARRHQDGREPRPCARPVPQDHPQARHQADRRRRHRGLGARDRRARRQDLRRDRDAARRRNLRPRHPGRERRGRGAQHHALHRAVAREEVGAARQGQGRHHLRVPGARTCRRRSTRRWAASPPTAST